MKTLCWVHYDSNRFKMLVTESLCWRIFCVCDRSPTSRLSSSKRCHQLISSPTLVDVVGEGRYRVSINLITNMLLFPDPRTIKNIVLY